MYTVSHHAPVSASATPPRPATIIDYLGGPLASTCTKCSQRTVTVCWVPNEVEFAAWADYQEVLFNYCHRCAVEAAPAMYRAELERRFAHILAVRRTLHIPLTFEPGPDDIYRTTSAKLTYMTWRPSNRSGSDDPFLEEFSIAGWLPEGFDEEVARRTLAPSPTFRTVPRSEREAGSALWAVAQMAIHARHPAVPNAYLELRWDPDSPDLAWDPIIRGFRHETPENIARIAYNGRRLFAIHRSSSGRYPDEPEIVCAVFNEQLPDAIKNARDTRLKDEGVAVDRPLRQRELAKSLGISVDTLQLRLKDCRIAWPELRLRQE